MMVPHQAQPPPPPAGKKQAACCLKYNTGSKTKLTKGRKRNRLNKTHVGTPGINLPVACKISNWKSAQQIPLTHFYGGLCWDKWHYYKTLQSSNHFYKTLKHLDHSVAVLKFKVNFP
jgi:hypothetical protein